MRYAICLAAMCVMAASGVSMADTFGSGANQFTIDFVPISGDTGNLGSWSAGFNYFSDVGFNYTFSGVNHGDYRMGTYEITNAQWTKFKSAYGPVKGTPTYAYGHEPYFPGTSVPTNMVSWYEAAQFVNWLNTSSGKSAAYKFTGTQGTSGYTLGVWSASDAGYNAANPYRNSNAKYFLPTENEWIKAAYWNGSNLQTYATKAGESLYQGNGSNGGWNYYTNGYVTNPNGPWNVGSGSEELNGTYDMMGNVLEWMESPYTTGDYTSDSLRGLRGGLYGDYGFYLKSSYRSSYYPNGQSDIGFRVASIPEPASLVLLGLGGLALRYRKR